MNTQKLFVLVTSVAVALSLSACTVIGAPVSEGFYPKGPQYNSGVPVPMEVPPQEGDILTDPETMAEPEETYDAWVFLTENRTDKLARFLEEKLASVNDQFGDGLSFEASDEEHYTHNWVGVSKFHEYCVVVYFEDAQTELDGSAGVKIFSRYDPMMEPDFIDWTSNYEILNDAVQYYADWCTGGLKPAPYIMDPQYIVEDMHLEEETVSA